MHCTAMGRGPELVMVPGWGMHGQVLAPLAKALSACWRVTLVDLPGHGLSSPTSAFTLAGIGAELVATLPRNAVWLGWSLGAQLVLNAAACMRPRGLILLAGTPRFTRADDWPYGLPGEALDDLARELATSPARARRQFLGLLAAGGDGRQTVRALRCLLDAAPEPNARMLAGGLDILATADLRGLLPALDCPALWITGDADPLTAQGAAEFAAARMPHASAIVIKNAGHMAFLSQTRVTAATINRFLQQTMGQA